MRCFGAAKPIVGALCGLLGAVGVYVSLAEGFFFRKVIDQGSQAVLSQGYSKQVIDLAAPLVANGTIRFLDYPTKAGIAVISLLLLYIGLAMIINRNNPDFTVKSFFSRDYWMKFNAFKYEKTRVRKVE
ncbi:hypothetical protein ACI2KR_07330 [Pseudomonas luteola]